MNSPKSLGLSSATPSNAEFGRLPNFLIIGAARSGTTTLHYVLAQHPHIYMSPNKETNFFSYHCSDGQTPICTRLEDVGNVDGRSARSLEAYGRLFRGVTQEIAVGETSPSYLLTTGVAEAIRGFIPEAKLIAVLRQPIDKAYSHYVRKCQAGLYGFRNDFAAVLEEDRARVRSEGRGFSFLDHGRYCEYLKPYYDVFERDRLKICLFEDMDSQPDAFYADLFRFLGVDESFRADTGARFNQSGRSRGRALASLTNATKPLRNQLRMHLPPSVALRLSHWRHKLQSSNVDRPPALPPALRRDLTERYFGEEIARLQDLLGRDLSHWLD